MTLVKKKIGEVWPLSNPAVTSHINGDTRVAYQSEFKKSAKFLMRNEKLTN